MTGDMADISIIMPVFDTGRYLEESVGSILRQTYADFELICIDDASGDGSLGILKDLQRRDPRIVIIEHGIRRGAAVSRNDGLKIAKGEYVLFLDSDDRFYPDMLEVIYGHAVRTDADVVMFGSETLENGALRRAVPQYMHIDTDEQKELFLPKVRHVPWDKLVRKKILSEHGIWFQDIPTNNDIFYSFASVLASERICVCGEALLQYRYRRAGSLTDIRSFRENHTIDAFYALYQFALHNRQGDRMEGVLMNLIADNIQSYLSDESYPLRIRRDSLQALLGYGDMLDRMQRYERNDVLYPHNQEFVRRLVNGMDVCGTGYDQYLLYGARKLIEERRDRGEKLALWGCGRNGRVFLRLMDREDIRIDYVVDEDCQIQGQQCGRYRIRSYDEVADQITTILITNLAYKKEVESRAKGKEVIYVWK